MLYQRTTYLYGCLENKLSCRISHATLNHISNVSDSRTVVLYAEHSYLACRFQAMCVSTQKWAFEKTLRMHVLRHNSPIVYTLHSAPAQKKEITDCTAVVRYVDGRYTTCSFRFTSLSTQKMPYRKEIVMRVQIHNLLSTSAWVLLKVLKKYGRTYIR